MKKNKIISIVTVVVVLVLAVTLYTNSQYSSFQKVVLDSIDEAKIMVPAEASTSKMREVEMSVRYMVYDSLKDLEQAADLIIIGTPSQFFEERDQNSAYYSDGTVQDFYTLTDVGIFKIIKQPIGWVDTKQMEVVEPVGTIKEADGVKTKIKAAGYNEMVPHTKYIIFLKKNSMGQYSIINMDNGKFEVEGPEHPDLKTGGDQTAEIKQKLWEEIISKYEWE